MNTLALCDDRWHPALTVRDGLAPLEERGFTFDWIEDAREWSAARLQAHPVIILSKSNEVSSAIHEPWASDEVQAAFVDYVQGGGGLLAIHSGAAGYDACPALRALVGGAFTHHPPQCDVTVQPLQGHPLSVGAEAFTVHDEHYFMALDDEGADVFLTTRSEHGEQVGGWTRRVGAGRTCVLSPGHNLEVWLQPSYQTLIFNALRWCAGEA